MERELIKYTREEFNKLCKKIGITPKIKRIDKKKIDLSIKPPAQCILQNLCNQFNIPMDLPKKINPAWLEWTMECEKEFEKIMKNKISYSYGKKGYFWFKLNLYPLNSDWKK